MPIESIEISIDKNDNALIEIDRLNTVSSN